MSDEVRLGLYEHFKGSKHVVLSIARHSEHWDDRDKDMVIYLHGDTIVARPVSLWTQEVEWPDGSHSPRFKYVKGREDMLHQQASFIAAGKIVLHAVEMGSEYLRFFVNNIDALSRMLDLLFSVWSNETDVSRIPKSESE